MKRIFLSLILGNGFGRGCRAERPAADYLHHHERQLVYDEDEHGNRVPDFSTLRLCGRRPGNSRLRRFAWSLRR